MEVLIVIIHVVVCLSLIVIVLLQAGKGADMGAAFGGGGSQTLFGSTGASTFLGKATTAVAVIFMLTCFTLAYMSTQQKGSSIMEDVAAPAEEAKLPEVPTLPGEAGTEATTPTEDVPGPTSEPVPAE